MENSNHPNNPTGVDGQTGQPGAGSAVDRTGGAGGWGGEEAQARSEKKKLTKWRKCKEHVGGRRWVRTGWNQREQMCFALPVASLSRGRTGDRPPSSQARGAKLP